MKTSKSLSHLVLISILAMLVFSAKSVSSLNRFKNPIPAVNLAHDSLPIKIKIKKDVPIRAYFQYLDSLVRMYNTQTPYILTEHLIVRSNPWIIDTLQNTDYYRMKLRDSFVYDQKKMIALPRGNYILIPDSIQAISLKNSFKNTTIDVNIPEFKLRIYENSVKLFEFPIRVGRFEKKYLKMSNRVEDLRTKTGTGIIIGYVKNPRYANPVNNHEYKVTKRDDGKITLVPKIPFIETELNGLRYGQFIHPTTNPNTLGKAYSNGCIGVKEDDAWVIYYYAPIGTKINVRYDLDITAENGDTIILKDIYGYKK
ncbi:L,D-transpeptidase [Flavobacteriaceae bacterium GSB9]|nr:L,D-transpeptidase [Flavobacteriaceae bacterium GSB9]